MDIYDTIHVMYSYTGLDITCHGRTFEDRVNLTDTVYVFHCMAKMVTGGGTKVI